MNELEKATLEELWAEVKKRVPAAIMVYSLPDKIGDGGCVQSFIHGRTSQAVGLCEIAKIRLIGRMMDQ